MLARIDTRPYALIAFGYLAGYVTLDWLSYAVAQPTERVGLFAAAGITPWSPSTGLSVALILLLGYRFIPCLVVSPIVADALVRGLPLPIGMEIFSSVMIAGGYGGMCAALMAEPLRFEPKLKSKRDLFLLLGAAILASALLGLCHVGLIVSAGLIGGEKFWPAMVRYWVGDMIGITILTPFLLVLLNSSTTPVTGMGNASSAGALGRRPLVSFWLRRRVSVPIVLSAFFAGRVDRRSVRARMRNLGPTDQPSELDHIDSANRANRLESNRLSSPDGRPFHHRACGWSARIGATTDRNTAAQAPGGACPRLST